MKHPYLCCFFAIALSFTAYQPGFRLNAADLWNKTGVGVSAPSYYVEGQAKKKGNSGIYYNNRDGSNSYNQKTLYNVKDPSALAAGKRRDRLNAMANNYKGVNTSNRKQRPSKQFAFMSSDAVANRQADIDLALQNEYNRRKETAQNMRRLQESSRRSLIAADKAEDKRLKELEARRQKYMQERERKKAMALKGKGVLYSGTSKSTKASRAGYSSYTSSSSTGLKKPKRLFNDPNN